MRYHKSNHMVFLINYTSKSLKTCAHANETRMFQWSWPDQIISETFQIINRSLIARQNCTVIRNMRAMCWKFAWLGNISSNKIFPGVKITNWKVKHMTPADILIQPPLPSPSFSSFTFTHLADAIYPKRLALHFKAHIYILISNIGRL